VRRRQRVAERDEKIRLGAGAIGGGGPRPRRIERCPQVADGFRVRAETDCVLRRAPPVAQRTRDIAAGLEMKRQRGSDLRRVLSEVRLETFADAAMQARTPRYATS